MNQRSDNRIRNRMVLDLKEMIWCMLERWKFAIVVVLCVALAFLGYMYMRNAKAANQATKEQQANQELTREAFLDSLSPGDRAVVVDADLLVQEQKQQLQYIETAPLMKVDATKAKLLRARWSVETETNTVTALVQEYILALQKETITESLMKSSGISTTLSQFKELISFGQVANETSATINFDILLTDDMDAEAIANEMERVVYSAHGELIKKLGDHKFQGYQSDIVNASSQDIVNRQIGVRSLLTGINSQLPITTGAFTPEQRAAFDKLQLIKSAAEGSATTVSPARTLTPKNLVIGLALGVIAYIACYLLCLLFTKRVMSARVLNGTSAHAIGEWYSVEDEKKKFFLTQSLPIWKWHHKQRDKERALRQCAESISGLCRLKSMTKPVLLMLSELTDSKKAFAQELKETLKNDNIDLQLFEQKSSDGVVPDSQTLLNAEGFVVTVVESKTRLGDLASIIEVCSDYEKPILGSLYLG